MYGMMVFMVVCVCRNNWVMRGEGERQLLLCYSSCGFDIQ